MSFSLRRPCEPAGNLTSKEKHSMTGKGLEGVVAATTALSLVDGTAGRLVYRGYAIGDLAAHATFEETAYLLWYGKLPGTSEASALGEQMAAEWALPGNVTAII